MSSTTLSAVLLTVSLTAAPADTDKVVVPKPVIEAGLKKAHCTIPPRQAEIVGTERLGNRLGIVEVTCWRDANNAGSVLFAVPDDRPQAARVIMLESWHDGRIEPSFSVSAPGYDPKSRTLNSNRQARSTGDCGTIEEWKWSGWHFQLINAWRKDRCDGEPFEWDSRDRWQVFPRQVSPQRGLRPGVGGAVSSENRQQASR